MAVAGAGAVTGAVAVAVVVCSRLFLGARFQKSARLAGPLREARLDVLMGGKAAEAPWL